jgi:maleate isomerase
MSSVRRAYGVGQHMRAVVLRAVAERQPFDDRPARWRIGLIALATDHTSERDFARMRPNDEVAVYVNRIAYANPTTVENLARMASGLTEAARLILPGEPLDALAYSCTAASVVIGDAAVAEAIHAAKPGVPCITPVAAARAALEALGATRISVLTPYTPEVSETVGRYFSDHGVEVLSLACLGLEDDRVMARLRPEAIMEAAVEAMDPDAEALFISCTALRAAQIAEAIEARLGKPVVTSNQAMMWRALRAAGCAEHVDGYGRLLRI